MATQRTNHSSLLLNTTENNVVTSTIGADATANSIGVTQLYTTIGPSHDKWIYKGSGAIALIRDRARKSYFLRFLSLDGDNIDMEQELYKSIVLHKYGNFFLSFEAHACMWGLLFCDKSEMALLETEILSKIRSKSSNKIEKKSSVQLRSSAKKSEKTSKSLGEAPTIDKKDKKKKEKPQKKGKKESRPKLEISAPSNFIVVAHVGHDGISGLENMQDSGKWKELIQFIYGTSAEITQEETSHLMDLVTKNGGIEKYTEAIEKTKKKSGKTDKSSKKSAAPPPTPKPTMPPTPAKSKPTPPLPKTSVAPPPPPPPPPSAVPPPINTTPAPPAKNVAPSLHDQIHRGTILKKVEVVESSDEEEAEGLLGALVNNLSAFRQKVKASSSEDSSDDSGDDSDDDW